jgi:hypothetical protein
MDDDTATWVVVLLVALVAVPAIALLAGPVGRALYGHASATDWPWVLKFFHPEPREQGMYELSLGLPVVLSAGVLLTARRTIGIPPRLAVALAWIARAALALTVPACLFVQYRLRYEWLQGSPRDRFFSPPTLAAATLIAAAIAVGIRSAAVRGRVAEMLRESRGRAIGATFAAVAFTAIWLLHAVNTDHSVAWSQPGTVANLAITSGETFALINGLTPLVNVDPIYGLLWPYVFAPPLLLFGKTLLVFLLATTVVTALSLLCVFGILRRVTGSAVSALVLYLPFLAMTLFSIHGTPTTNFTTANYLADYPLRYGGVLFLAWLTARELDRRRERLPWALFTAAGLILIDNISAGAPALAATAITLVAVTVRTRRSAIRFAAGAVGGLATAVAGVVLVTLLRAGEVPHLWELSANSRRFLAGFMATPMHSVLGLHFAIYVTYVAAIVVAVVRLQRRAPGDVLTGMLLWNGVFGLVGLSYFVVESGPMWLAASFASWALSLVLLVVVIVRRLAAHGRCWPSLPELAVLFGFGLIACSLAQTSAPWAQIDRLTRVHHERVIGLARSPFVPDPRAKAFIASLATPNGFYLQRGAPVALAFENGYRVADAYGVANVSQYTDLQMLKTPSTLKQIVAALRRAGGNTIVFDSQKEYTEQFPPILVSLGFGMVTAHGIADIRRHPAVPLTRWVRGEPLIKWVDLHNLHPRVLEHGHPQLVARTRVLPG